MSILVGKAVGNEGKVGNSGERCRWFYVNDVRSGIGLGRSDLVDNSVDKGDKCRERLGECGLMGSFGWCKKC